MDPREGTSEDEYIIAQLTIPNNKMETMSVNIQGEVEEEHGGGTWIEYDIEFILYPQGREGQIPSGCSLWYDGCNICQVIDGELGTCSKNMCLINGDPECRMYQSGH